MGNGKYLRINADTSEIVLDEIINATNSVSANLANNISTNMANTLPTNVTSTMSTYFQNINVR